MKGQWSTFMPIVSTFDLNSLNKAPTSLTYVKI